jgi:hypothetical protein
MIVGLIVGAVLVGVGFTLLKLKGRSADRLLEVRATKTSAAGDVVQLARDVAAEIGPGGFAQLVEVKGTTSTSTPLTSELAEKPCVWYRMKVEERFEETYVDTDANGNRVRRTRTGSETVASNERTTPFDVSDGTGSIRVDLASAQIDGVKEIDRHEPVRDGAASLGAFRFSARNLDGRQVIGYHYTEHLIPVGAHVYVIGEATDRIEGTLAIRKPQESDEPFIVTTRSEEEVTKSLKTKVAVMKWSGIGLIAAGVAAVILGIAGLFG